MSGTDSAMSPTATGTSTGLRQRRATRATRGRASRPQASGDQSQRPLGVAERPRHEPLGEQERHRRALRVVEGPEQGAHGAPAQVEPEEGLVDEQGPARQVLHDAHGGPERDQRDHRPADPPRIARLPGLRRAWPGGIGGPLGGNVRQEDWGGLVHGAGPTVTPARERPDPPPD